MDSLGLIKEEYTNIVRNIIKSDSNIVWGEGNKNSNIMLIGEAPGQKEEESGKPFVGAAGKNLDEFLDILEISRDIIYITNIVKIRTYKINTDTGRKSNRTPNKNEINLSLSVLKREIDIINPQIIVTLGNTPLRALLGDNASIGVHHGNQTKYDRYILFPLYHPASIIYNRNLRDVYIEDLHKLKKLFDIVVGR